MSGAKKPSRREYRPFSDAELAVLRERYATTETRELAQEMGRSPRSVRQMACRLNLRKTAAFKRRQAFVNARGLRLDGTPIERFEKDEEPGFEHPRVERLPGDKPGIVGITRYRLMR